MRRASWILGLAAAVLGAFALGLAAVGGGTREGRGSTSVVEQVRAQLAAHYYRAVPERILRMQDVESMLGALGDPYTELLDPARYRLLRRETAGTYAGVGMTVLPADDGLLVAGTQRGPARLAGIRPGDTILAIDGFPARRLSYEEALGRILGPDGSAVSLQVRRAARTLRFRLVRERFEARSVHVRMLALARSRVGYLRVDSFSLGTAQMLSRGVRRLERARARGLVLDLRGNPGGLLDQAVASTSVFLDGGVVTSLSGAHQPEQVYRAGRGPATRLPLVVLVDRGSASASEVVAAALRDNGRARLVGEQTFGKGLVQSVRPVGTGAALKLTVARYLTPDGADLSRRGIRPEVIARDDPATATDEALEVAVSQLNRR